MTNEDALTSEDYKRAEQYLPWNCMKLAHNTMTVPVWINKSDQFWYQREIEEGTEFVLIDPETNTRTLAFDHKKVAQVISATTGNTYDGANLPFSAIEFSEDLTSIEFQIKEDVWVCQLESYSCSKKSKAFIEKPIELMSPDKQWAAYLKDHNLYVRSTATGDEFALTQDGEPQYDYGTSPEYNTHYISDQLRGIPKKPIISWSPDSKFLIVERLDQRNVKELHLLQSVPTEGYGRPILHTYRYPMPGDDHVGMSELVIFNVEQRKRIDVQHPPILALYFSLIEEQMAWWNDNSTKIYFVDITRGHKTARLCEINPATGAVRVILEEKSDTFIDIRLLMDRKLPNVRFINGETEFIWFSELDGWAHLYLHDAQTGQVKNQITSGEWVVWELLHVDEVTRQVYFVASGKESGRDPYYQHVYRINLDGSGLELLTPQNATHIVFFSPTGNYFVDTYSTVNIPPLSVLRSADGEVLQKLEEADIDQIKAFGWKLPETFHAKARDDETDIYGMIFFPSHFDPTKQYPVIDAIYPGPQVIRTPKMFSTKEDMLTSALFYWDSQALAELGFIVITIDGLGKPLRSKAYHNFSYGNLEDGGGLADNIAALKQLRSTRPYLDLERVGIYGYSGGGFASTRAIFLYPDFYKVAVSGAGNHDQRGYLLLWGEKYHGLVDGENYVPQANMSIAKNLKGKLLLIHGDMDDNVHPALTMQVVNALIKANKDFELLIMPNLNHGTSLLDAYYTRKQWDYFVMHLLGKMPPKEHKIKEPDPEYIQQFTRA